MSIKILLAGAATVSFMNAAEAQETLDNTAYAQAIANHIVEACHANESEAASPDNVINCITAGATTSMTIATDMRIFIQEVSRITSPFWAGTAQGDLMANCLTPMDLLGGQQYSNLTNYLYAAFNAVRSCEDSMRRAGDAVGIDFQPTARNTVYCHMNRLKGLDCNFAE